MMKQFFLLVTAFFLLGACDHEPEESSSKKKPSSDTQVEEQVTNFTDDQFANERSLSILEELDVCVLNDSLGIAECTPKNFRLIPFKKDVPLEDAFILEIKAGILLKGSMDPLPPIRHVIVFERVNGELVKVNGFRGDLIATTKGKAAKNIILALYIKEDETLFHCKYKWDGSEYQFTSIEGLDWGDGVVSLTESTRDSVTNEIYGSIMQSNLIF